MIVRPARESDAPAMLAIYGPYVESSVISFEQAVPSIEEYTARVRQYLAGWAAVVVEAQGQVLGYAYGSSHRERAAYRWPVQNTVYVAASAQRRGIGRCLYRALIPMLQDAGYCNAYAGVALPNAASVALHRASASTRSAHSRVWATSSVSGAMSRGFTLRCATHPLSRRSMITRQRPAAEVTAADGVR